MKGEHIMDAMEWVDEELVDEAAHMRQRRRAWWPRMSLAACVCLVVAGTVVAQLWHPSAQVDGAADGEESNQMELELGSPGVYVPPMEVELEGDAHVEADMSGFFIYQGRSYVECSWISNGSQLVGEKLGSSDGGIDEWTPEHGYVEGSGTAWGDFYAVNGYDPTHLLCMTREDGTVVLYWNNNDITVQTGNDVLGGVFHLPGQIAEVTIQGTTMEGGTAIAAMDSFRDWVEVLGNTPAMAAETINLTWKDVRGRVIVKKTDGVTLHLILYNGGYVKIGGLEQVCWQLDWASIAQWKG